MMWDHQECVETTGRGKSQLGSRFSIATLSRKNSGTKGHICCGTSENWEEWYCTVCVAVGTMGVFLKVGKGGG
jgi:hypothetical protein